MQLLSVCEVVDLGKWPASQPVQLHMYIYPCMYVYVGLTWSISTQYVHVLAYMCAYLNCRTSTITTLHGPTTSFTIISGTIILKMEKKKREKKIKCYNSYTLMFVCLLLLAHLLWKGRIHLWTGQRDSLLVGPHSLCWSVLESLWQNSMEVNNPTLYSCRFHSPGSLEMQRLLCRRASRCVWRILLGSLLSNWWWIVLLY